MKIDLIYHKPAAINPANPFAAVSEGKTETWVFDRPHGWGHLTVMKAYGGQDPGYVRVWLSSYRGQPFTYDNILFTRDDITYMEALRQLGYEQSDVVMDLSIEDVFFATGPKGSRETTT